MDEILRRRELSSQRMGHFAEQLKVAQELAKDKACVYVSGSYGRGEATEHSDLDLFIVGRTERISEDRRIARLGKLDEVLVKADLINQARSLGFPEFDKEGSFIVQHLIDDIVSAIGTPGDDNDNTFTARLLLLLESKPVCEKPVYIESIGKVIEPYWRDYDGHEADFIPAFLVNDILRLWRTFCVNYEAASSRAQKRKSPKIRIKNYKLKHSRVLTCFSSIIYCQAVVCAMGAMSKDDAISMIELTPLERLDAAAKIVDKSNFNERIDECLAAYNSFLEVTNDHPENLERRFGDESEVRTLFEGANRFGDLIAQTIQELDLRNRITRIIMV